MDMKPASNEDEAQGLNMVRGLGTGPMCLTPCQLLLDIIGLMRRLPALECFDQDFLVQRSAG